MSSDAETVSLRLTHVEARRLGIALEAGFDTVSRAEYYIRTGLAQPAVKAIADALQAQMAEADPVILELGRGVEEVENPRRPRPANPDA